MSDDKDGVKGVYLVVDNSEEIATPKEGGGDGGEPLRPVEYSDDALAAELSRDLGDDWKCISANEVWHHWTGARWEREETKLILYRSRKVRRRVADGCDNKRIARSVSSKASPMPRRGSPARSTPCHDARRGRYHPWLLNMRPASSIAHGKIGPHDRTALITRITAAAPEGDAPLFDAFLREAPAATKSCRASSTRRRVSPEWRHPGARDLLPLRPGWHREKCLR